MQNKLLARQIKRFLKNIEMPAEYAPLLQAISDSYDHYEADRSLLERSLEVSSQELNEANGKIREAFNEIKRKNKDITDSIYYAQRIQQAILPATLLLREYFNDSFILYKPKDIVSGDFYWIETKPGKMLFSAVDCTGHGVPGAFMSMIGSALLNEIVGEKNVTRPSEILAKLRQGIIYALKNKEQGSESKDGMDISLCSVDYSNNMLEFAGAFNPLWLIRNGQIIEYKADKFPIGNYVENESKAFANQTISLQKGDTIYIFSDGYADQFGGERGKKFKNAQLRNLLLGCQTLKMKEQMELIEKIYMDWKGELEQVDDVLLMGVRV